MAGHGAHARARAGLVMRAGLPLPFTCSAAAGPALSAADWRATARQGAASGEWTRVPARAIGGVTRALDARALGKGVWVGLICRDWTGAGARRARWCGTVATGLVALYVPLPHGHAARATTDQRRAETGPGVGRLGCPEAGDVEADKQTQTREGKRATVREVAQVDSAC